MGIKLAFCGQWFFGGNNFGPKLLRGSSLWETFGPNCSEHGGFGWVRVGIFEPIWLVGRVALIVGESGCSNHLQLDQLRKSVGHVGFEVSLVLFDLFDGKCFRMYFVKPQYFLIFS